MRSALLGVLQTLGTTLAFVLGGVAAAALYPPAMPSGTPPELPAPAAPDAPAGGERWLVDGYNVIQVALLAGRERDAWWSAARRAELLERADAAPGHVAVEVVFDGTEPAPPRSEGAGGAAPLAPLAPLARVVFAPSADDWILAQLGDAPAGASVVTADRRLASRARARGAAVLTPREFLARCAAPAPPPGTRLARR